MKNNKALGIGLVFFGLFFLIKNVFIWDIEFFKLTLSGLLLFSGYYLLKPSLNINENPVHIKSHNSAIAFEEINIIFGEREITVGAISMPKKEIIANCIFGELTLFIPNDLPVKFQSFALFAEVNLPKHQKHSFGTVYYESHPGLEPKLIITIKSIFAQVNIKSLHI